MEKSAYETLLKAHKLPEYEALDQEFDIVLIEEGSNPLKSIIKTIHDCLDSHAKHLEDLLHPDSNLSTMFEIENFSEEEKKQTYTNYKQLMFLIRHTEQLLLTNSLNAQEQFLQKILEEWIPLKEQLLKIIIKQKEYWKQIARPEEVLGYLG
ncbi:hypothetical protein CMO92_04455 [Candidatus Woesearchaeota archaeon]|nr:hypothetical protein [Candidatus Woesearchaeota archaeon]|tara:strand:- start:199 stop:654 length:456 start_codon:yes stop_codon:yes gene_type:complete